MIFRKLTTLSLLFFASFSAFSQRYTAMADFEIQPYGLSAQLWNGSSTPLMLESVDASGAAISICDTPNQCHPYTVADGVVEFGYGLSNKEEQQCQSVNGYLLGGTSQIPSPNDGVRVSQQPCTPNGMAYGVAYSGPGSCGGYNYTCTNFIPLKRCWAFGAVTCNFDITSSPIAIAPNTGITVYAMRYKDPYAFGWSGNVTVSFRWHR